MGVQRERVIQAVYAAAMDRKPWQLALSELAEFTGCKVITLDQYDLIERAGTILQSNMAPEPLLEEYNHEFGRSNFQIEAAAPHYRPGGVLKSSDHTPRKRLLASDLYNCVYRPLGIRDAAGIALEATESNITQFTFVHSEDDGDFSTNEIGRLRKLSPHLQQAWAGYQHICQLNSSLEESTTLWDCFRDAVIVLDALLFIRFANKAAERLLGEGVCLFSRSGRLGFSGSGCTAVLKKNVRDVLNRHRDIASLSGLRGVANGEVQITLFRLRRNRVALIVSSGEHRVEGYAELVQSYYELSPAEADVVDSLLNGIRLREYAARRKICYETARTHLRNAMTKNGWRSQGQMISEVFPRLFPKIAFLQITRD